MREVAERCKTEGAGPGPARASEIVVGDPLEWRQISGILSEELSSQINALAVHLWGQATSDTRKQAQEVITKQLLTKPTQYVWHGAMDRYFELSAYCDIRTNQDNYRVMQTNDKSLYSAGWNLLDWQKMVRFMPHQGQMEEGDRRTLANMLALILNAEMLEEQHGLLEKKLAFFQGIKAGINESRSKLKSAIEKLENFISNEIFKDVNGRLRSVRWHVRSAQKKLREIADAKGFIVEEGVEPGRQDPLIGIGGIFDILDVSESIFSMLTIKTLITLMSVSKQFLSNVCGYSVGTFSDSPQRVAPARFTDILSDYRSAYLEQRFHSIGNAVMEIHVCMPNVRGGTKRMALGVFDTRLRNRLNEADNVLRAAEMTMIKIAPQGDVRALVWTDDSDGKAMEQTLREAVNKAMDGDRKYRWRHPDATRASRPPYTCFRSGPEGNELSIHLSIAGGGGGTKRIPLGVYDFDSEEVLRNAQWAASRMKLKLWNFLGTQKLTWSPNEAGRNTELILQAAAEEGASGPAF